MRQVQADAHQAISSSRVPILHRLGLPTHSHYQSPLPSPLKNKPSPHPVQLRVSHCFCWLALACFPPQQTAVLVQQRPHTAHCDNPALNMNIAVVPEPSPDQEEGEKDGIERVRTVRTHSLDLQPSASRPGNVLQRFITPSTFREEPPPDGGLKAWSQVCGR